MPTFRSITTSLISQFDLLTIPEYPPPAEPGDPFTTIPTLIEQGTITVYIPTYPSSQFWICYSISPPHPPKQLFYFKLYLNGVCVMSWGCGGEDGYAGKTMFGLYDSGETFFGQPAIEKRMLCFSNENGRLLDPSVNNLKDVMEVKVFRSNGRKRIPPGPQHSKDVAAARDSTMKSPQQHGGGGISLVNAGLLPTRHPRHYYKYALIDSLDQPFAKFRYYYRSWETLQRLGIRCMSPPPDMSISPSPPSPHPDPPPERPLAPNNDSTISVASDSTFLSLSTLSNDTEPVNDAQPAMAITSLSSAVQVLRPTTPIPEDPSSPTKEPSSSPRSLEDPLSPIDRKPMEEATRPRTPKPASTSSSRKTQAHFADFKRVLSPSKGCRTPTSTPSPNKGQRFGSMGMLLDVVSNAMRRRARGSSEERRHPIEGDEMKSNESEELEIFRNGDNDVPTSRKVASNGEGISSNSENGEEKPTDKIEETIKSERANGETGGNEGVESEEGMISRERRGRIGKKLHSSRGLSLWETL